MFSLPLSFSACPTSKMKGELRSRCFEACIYTEYTLFTPSVSHLSFASASLPYVQRGSISLSLYPTKHTKSPYFIHIIILSIKVGNFYLLTSSLCNPLFNFSLVWLSLLGRGGQSMCCYACVYVCSDEGGEWGKERKRVQREGEKPIPGCPTTSVSHMGETVTGNSLSQQLQGEMIKE